MTMQIPIEIDVRGEVPIHGVREKIEHGVTQIEKRFGRITGCRVVLKQPEARHQTGPYDIIIHLTLPQGKEVNVSQTPESDDRYMDIDFAIHDSFKRARRQLQDHVRRLQGRTKTSRNKPRAHR